jgi:hypothetical protein
MTRADSTTAFALNGSQAASYVPEAKGIYRDPRGGLFSLLIWTFFAVANAATAYYALTISDDRIMAIMFSLNAIGCLAIAGLTAFKRIDVTHRGTILWQRIATLLHAQDPVESARFAAVISSRCAPDRSPGARHHDEMIRQGLVS